MSTLILPGPGPRAPIDLESALLFSYSSADAVLGGGLVVPRAGSPLTLVRATDRTIRDANGASVRIPYGMPGWSADDDAVTGQFDSLGLLLEGARTNAWATDSRNLGTATYTKTATTVATDGSFGPDGLTLAYKLKEDGTTAAHILIRATPALTASTRQAFRFAVDPAERTWIYVTIKDKAAALKTTWINLATLVLGTTDATHQVVLTQEGNFVQVLVTFDAGVGATAPTVTIGLTTGNAVTSYAGTVGSGVYLTDFQFETDKPFASTFSALAGARATEVLVGSASWPFQDITVYAKLHRPTWAGLTGTLVTDQVILSISSVANGSLAVQASGALRSFYGFLTDGVGATSFVGGAIPAGNTVAVAAQFTNLRTAPKVRVDVGAGYGAYSTPVAALSGFANPVLWIGDLASGPGNNLFASLMELRIAAGARTFADLARAY